VPATGKIKNVDFFIKGIPFDLKLTYYPRAYQKKRIIELQLIDPIKLIKDSANKLDLQFPVKVSDDQLSSNLLSQIKDSDINLYNQLRSKIEETNFALLNDLISNKSILIKWLYENQGEMRFGAENRIYIIFFKLDSLYESWKLKRNFKLVETQIQKFIENYSPEDNDDLLVEFQYNKQDYMAYSDTIVVSA
jgi:hypothetical protein